jgi:hypothetical protein
MLKENPAGETRFADNRRKDTFHPTTNGSAT